MLTLKSTILFLITLLFLISCGPSKLTLTPNYNNEELAKHNYKQKTKVVSTLDNRNKEENIFGSAQVGLFNKKVPYLMKGKISEFVEESINKMIFKTEIDSSVIPIKVIIDQFEVYEKTGAFSEIGNFDCVLNFVYPVTEDSLISIRTETHQEYSGMDVTNSLEKLVYKGVASCVDTFITTYQNQKSSYLVNTSDTSLASKFSVKEFIEVEEAKKTVRKRKTSSTYIGFTYSTGMNIDYGLQFLYQSFDSLKTNLYGGFGYTIQYTKIIDTDMFHDAYFLNYNFRYALRYFLSEENKGFYLGGALRLIFGTEKLTYYNGEKTNYFIGPNFEEVIGYSINDKVMFEFGSYQIKLFGSDLLSSDIGYSLGVMFAL